MIILDENFSEPDGRFLRNRHLPVKRIGEDIGRRGMDDRQIIALLHRLNRPTLFTLDHHFFRPELCHGNYCLIFLDVLEIEASRYVIRVLRHRQFNTKRKRLGCVIRVIPTGLNVWRIREHRPIHLPWKE